MTDFIKFCPNCRTLFRDSDLYHRHLATCGAVQVQETEALREPAVKTAGKRSQKTGVRSQEREEGGKQVGSEPKTSDSSYKGLILCCKRRDF